jgi:hypothetical protein
VFGGWVGFYFLKIRAFGRSDTMAGVANDCRRTQICFLLQGMIG